MNRRLITKTGCWEWQGHCMNSGYGQISAGKKVLLVHRASYMEFVGDIPKGYMVCHKCDNPKCFNPDHLFVGTASDNMKDMVSKGRQKLLKGEDSPKAKLTNEQVQEIRRTHIWTEQGKRGGNTAEIAAKYNITTQYVVQLIKKEWRKNG